MTLPTFAAEHHALAPLLLTADTSYRSIFHADRAFSSKSTAAAVG